MYIYISFDNLFAEFNEMAHRNNIGPENKFPLLQNYLS